MFFINSCINISTFESPSFPIQAPFSYLLFYLPNSSTFVFLNLKLLYNLKYLCINSLSFSHLSFQNLIFVSFPNTLYGISSYQLVAFLSSGIFFKSFYHSESYFDIIIAFKTFLDSYFDSKISLHMP